MKKTIELIKKQNDVLVDVIRYLDSNKQADTEIRSQVDIILNHTDDLRKAAELELKSHEL